MHGMAWTVERIRFHSGFGSDASSRLRWWGDCGATRVPFMGCRGESPSTALRAVDLPAGCKRRQRGQSIATQAHCSRHVVSCAECALATESLREPPVATTCSCNVDAPAHWLLQGRIVCLPLDAQARQCPVMFWPHCHDAPHRRARRRAHG